ncbi:MAG: HPr family phosphocarrier protein [Lachnospiraceae bacterium]|nr:HPr family phosphocarrier protein [Lachnospiraceae bacterium]MCI1398759.1 HPr family phosphocarrier protein [Lachnospiraceae bacterium]MCI1423845.1 HPr family phosphocarrier protein [Lachnospiraceae bacterium]MCI1452303.1 HPr family phosphocarrier protein [Lachnospiraceae bacterium]
MRRFSFVVGRKEGLHARPAAVITQEAERFQSRILIRCGSRKLNGKSLMGLLALKAACGETLEVCIEGPDEEKAEQGMRQILAAQLGEQA